MTIDRRGFLSLGCAATAAVALGSVLTPSQAWALSEATAKSHVEATIAEVMALVQGGGSPASKAAQLRRIMEARAALPQIARFSAGRAWNQMDADQQSRFQDAFADYVASIYARRFTEYSGQQVAVGRVLDAGNKGLLVQSQVSGGGAPVVVEWLVSDRGGSVQIADIVIEGVSLLLTQREEIANMLNTRGDDVERLIQALATV